MGFKQTKGEHPTSYTPNRRKKALNYGGDLLEETPVSPWMDCSGAL
jgi:hypothetical protein